MTIRSTTMLAGISLVIAGLTLQSLSRNSAANDTSLSDRTETKPTAEVEANANDDKSAASVDSRPRPINVSSTLVDLNRAAETKIRQAMQKKLNVTLKNHPLNAFLTSLAEKGQFPLVLNETALNEEGIACDESLTDEFHDVTIEQALNWTLRPLGLVWVIEDEVLKVTTDIEANEGVFTRTYDVHDWVINKDAENTQDALYSDIVNGTSGRWPESGGAHGTMSFKNNVLVVRQTFQAQQEVAALLKAMTVMKTDNDDFRTSIRIEPQSYPHRLDRQIESALTKRISVSYRNTPLSTVTADLAKAQGIRIRILDKPLDEEGITTNERVSLTVNEVSLGSILHLLLEPVGLTYYVLEGALWITTEIDAEEFLYTVLYDVSDFVMTESDSEDLIELVQQESGGFWGGPDGTPGSIQLEANVNALVLRQTYKAHLEITQLLADLRATMAAQPKRVRPKRDPNALVTRVYKFAGMKIVDDLMTAVPKFVAKGSWSDNNKDTAIQQVGQTLVIRHTLQVHKRINRFLRQFGYFHNTGSGVGFF